MLTAGNLDVEMVDVVEIVTFDCVGMIVSESNLARLDGILAGDFGSILSIIGDDAVVIFSGGLAVLRSCGSFGVSVACGPVRSL